MTFYFYDLETSGVSPKSSRIMQFAGQRTNTNLEPIGEPDDMYVSLNRDVLPEPDAILITGITPQKTLQDGVTEAEFTKYFCENIAKPDTVFVGFNNIRFDDEFLRYTLYRNFCDAYEWHWRDGSSRWDMLDVVRMTRALRPEGINWPTTSDGSATNRLELLTAANNIDHIDAHTALADVNATIAIARLIKEKQPNLFDYMCKMRDKKEVKKLVLRSEPFTYVSGRYEGRYEKLTIAVLARELPDGSGALVYDLRYDPAAWAQKSAGQLADAMTNWQDAAELRLPFKVLQYNKCPSIAPAGAAKDSTERLGIDWTEISKNLHSLHENKALIDQVAKLFEERKKSFQTGLLPNDKDPDGRLYEGFLEDADRQKSLDVRESSAEQLRNMTPDFKDDRLNALFPLYKARNFSKLLTDPERRVWEDHVTQKVFASGAMDKFMKRLVELSGRSSLTEDQKYLLEELRLYAESITPAEP